MSNGVSSIIFFAIIAFLGYYAWVGVTPYYFHDTAPNVPMQTVIGNKAWYFPMGYIDPHYPQGGYSRGAETEVWLSLNSKDLRIIPQDVSIETLGIGSVIDVILSSDRNPKTLKAMQELKELNNQTGFENTPYGLKGKIIGNEAEYIGPDTRISCGPVNCTLFTTRIPDVRTAMVFNIQMLPAWEGIIETLEVELRPFRVKMPLGNIVKDFFTQQPTGVQKPATSPNGMLLPADGVMPETTIPTLNTK